jgi:hypothetical protein
VTSLVPLALLLTAAGAALAAAPAVARTPGQPIRLAWIEGDVAGLTPVRAADGKAVIGAVEYHQHREGERLTAVRVARFDDGSSDEDDVEAHVGGDLLETVRGRFVVRDAHGTPTVDLSVDVAGGHITGTVGSGTAARAVDRRESLPPGTYFGPLVFIVLKNFDANAENGRLRFRTVEPTPMPRVFDLEIRRDDATDVTRPGGAITAVRYRLVPTVNGAIDPLIRLIAPTTEFLMEAGTPPALVGFAGPRNYAGQEIRLE